MPTIQNEMRRVMRNWQEDLSPEWRCVLCRNGTANPKFDAEGHDREFTDQNPIFPGRRDSSMNGAPQNSHMFRAFDNLPPSAVKAVLIGEDPYPHIEQATGRSFERGDCSDSWLPLRGENTSSMSMQRFAQQLANFITNDTVYTTKNGWQTLKQHINRQKLTLPRPEDVFNHWQAKGVLMLNTALTFTCKSDIKYHKELWKPIVGKICNYLARECPSVIFLCFGKESEKLLDQEKIKIYLISNDRLVLRRHPARGIIYGNGGFLGEANIFREANKRLSALDRCFISWCPRLS